MALNLERFVKGKRFDTADFTLDDPTDKVKVNTAAGSSVAIAIAAAATPAATDTVQGKVSLAVAANYPSTSDVEAATPAYITQALSGLGATAEETIAGVEAVKFISPDDMSAALQQAAKYRVVVEAPTATSNAVVGKVFGSIAFGALGQGSGLKASVYGEAGGSGVWAGYFNGGESVFAGQVRFSLNASKPSSGTPGVYIDPPAGNMQIGGSTTTNRIDFVHGTAFVGSVGTTVSGTTYNTVSDYRLKTIDGPVTSSGEFIDALKPYIGEWKVTPGEKAAFFLAHEVQEVSPSTVKGKKDAVDKEGNPILQAMEYGSAEFIVNIVAELQALRLRVAELELKTV